jgi:hypothetical protein
MSPSTSGTTVQEKVFMAVVVGLVVGALALTAYPTLRGVPVARNAQPAAPAQPVQVAETGHSEARPAPPVEAVASTRTPRAIVEEPEPEPTPRMSTRSKPSAPFRWPPPSLTDGHSETDALGRTVIAPAVASTTTSAAASEAVTVSGCLEATVDGADFRLTDTEGADAPKARNWRSGFLKKRSAPVELVELSDPVGLRKYVGRRVTASGVLTGRELRVGSLQASGTSCE